MTEVKLDFQKQGGLIPAIILDHTSKEVLMLSNLSLSFFSSSQIAICNPFDIGFSSPEKWLSPICISLKFCSLTNLLYFIKVYHIKIS